MAYFLHDLLTLLLLYFILHESNAGRVVSHEEVVSFEAEYLDFRFRENPDYAVGYGLRVYRNKTEEWNFEAFQRRLDKSKDFRETVMEMLGAEFELDEDKLSMLVLKDNLDTYIKGSNYKNYTVVLNQGIISIDSTLKKFDVSSMEDLENWNEKVKLYTAMIEDQLTLLTDEQYADLYPVTKVALENFLFRLESQIQNDIPEFYAFKPWIDMNETTSQDFHTEGLNTCRKFRDKLVELYNYLNNTYYPNTARDSVGLAALPGGAEAYEAALRFHTSPDETAEKVHRIGLGEVERIGKLMKKISQDAEFEGVREYLDYLLNQTDETFATPELMTKGYEDMITQRINPNLHKEFDFVPNIDVVVKDLGSLGSLGSYTSPNLDGSIPGVFNFDGSNPRDILKVNMLSIAVHETSPGHHFQSTYAIDNDLTYFRRLREMAHYEQVPFNWPFYTPTSEGWALYAESLAPQLGISVNSKEDLGRLGLESLRAARLVVDTGIHHYNWTLEQATDYLYNHTTLGRVDCEKQIRRYIRWPGQACAYKIGQLEISALRAKAEQELGESLKIAKFHDKLLSVGPLALPLLRQEVLGWIESQKTNSANFNSMSILCLMLSSFFSLKFIY